MTSQDLAICVGVIVIAIWAFLIVRLCVSRQEALREIVREENMMDEYRILDPYKGPTCILSHKACKDMDCRKCVFALAEKLKEKR